VEIQNQKYAHAKHVYYITSSSMAKLRGCQVDMCSYMPRHSGRIRVRALAECACICARLSVRDCRQVHKCVWVHACSLVCARACTHCHAVQRLCCCAHWRCTRGEASLCSAQNSWNLCTACTCTSSHAHAHACAHAPACTRMHMHPSPLTPPYTHPAHACMPPPAAGQVEGTAQAHWAAHRRDQPPGGQPPPEHRHPHVQ